MQKKIRKRLFPERGEFEVLKYIKLDSCWPTASIISVCVESTAQFRGLLPSFWARGQTHRDTNFS